MVETKTQAVFAVFAYALMPVSYLWLIMGGGITRSIGMLFGILAVLSAWKMFHKPTPLAVFWVILTCSLTILSHPEVTWFVFLSVGLIGLRFGLNKRGILSALLALIGILLLTSPWWMAVIRQHGISVFFNAAHTGGLINLSILLFFFTQESFATILAVIALLGVFAELARRRYFLAIWMLLIAILSPRSGPYQAALPTALLFASGLVGVVLPGLTGTVLRDPRDDQLLAMIPKNRLIKLILGFLLVYLLFSAFAVPFYKSTDLAALSSADRQAMEWISHNLPPGSRFAVLSGAAGWPTDRVAEWFPALSKGISTATVQGSEWLPEQEFKQRMESYDRLQDCAVQDLGCLSTWLSESSPAISYLYISQSDADQGEARLPINYSLQSSDHFRLVFENQGVSIYQAVETP